MAQRHMVTFDNELWTLIEQQAAQACVPPTTFVRSVVMQKLRDAGHQPVQQKPGPKPVLPFNTETTIDPADQCAADPTKEGAPF